MKQTDWIKYFIGVETMRNVQRVTADFKNPADRNRMNSDVEQRVDEMNKSIYKKLSGDVVAVQAQAAIDTNYSDSAGRLVNDVLDAGPIDFTPDK